MILYKCTFIILFLPNNMLGINALFWKYFYIYVIVRYGKDVLILFTWTTWSLRKLKALFRRPTRKDR